MHTPVAIKSFETVNNSKYLQRDHTEIKIANFGVKVWTQYFIFATGCRRFPHLLTVMKEYYNKYSNMGSRSKFIRCSHRVLPFVQ